jgi:hypothetical protein
VGGNAFGSASDARWVALFGGLLGQRGCHGGAGQMAWLRSVFFFLRFPCSLFPV